MSFFIVFLPNQAVCEFGVKMVHQRDSELGLTHLKKPTYHTTSYW